MENIHNPVRSFVLRGGRMGKNLKHAFSELYSVYGLAADETPLNLEGLSTGKKTVLEIGFGMGEVLLQMAKDYPQYFFLGLEVHKPGIAKLLYEINKQKLSNLHIIRQDALTVLEKRLPEGSLNALHIFFPDPWPKKKHHKRRLIKSQNMEYLLKALKPGGYLHLATDWADYAKQMEEVLRQEKELQIQDPATVPLKRCTSRFEEKGLRKGHSIFSFYAVKRSLAC